MAELVQKARILRVRNLSQTVRELCIIPRDSKISFEPGQWVSLKLPVGDRPPLVRAYSMAEPESDSGRLVLVFDRVPGGIGTEYLSLLKEGDVVLLSGPYGKFVVPKPMTVELLLIARFTGIVPIRCILSRLFTSPPSPAKSLATLIYGAPTRDERIFDDELRALAASNRDFRYIPTILTGAGEEEGRPEIDIIHSEWEGRKDYYPMVCGVKEFVGPLKAYFAKRGFGRKEVKFETYD
jgi:ferredoxin-NADP reductase